MYGSHLVFDTGDPVVWVNTGDMIDKDMHLVPGTVVEIDEQAGVSVQFVTFDGWVWETFIAPHELFHISETN